ncbi:MAG: DUF3795 domain-containing protein [Bacteroidetes bacterium]|nr:DUF3795 domain-containing protein [Bacteroidota bacterium]
MSKELIGCCGAYCGTCKELIKMCKGCKVGYADKKRDIAKAKCKIKVCCINNDFVSCADCPRYENCSIIQEFQTRKGYKYKKYKEALSFIRENGDEQFLQITETWNKQYGKYER